MRLLRQRELPQEQLWYYDLYYQSYSADGTLTDENGAAYNWVKQTHGQGGWAFPDNEVSISQNKFDDKQFAWDAIDGSGKETLGVHYVFDENYGSHRLSALCKEVAKNNPLKIYYRAKPHTVTYQYEGNIPQGAPKVPDVVHTGYSAPVTVAANPVLEGYTFSGWKTQTPDSVEIENGKLTMPNQDVVLTGTWEKIPVPEQKTGGLKVSKTVTGNEGDTSRDFTFRVMLGNLSIEGRYGDMTFHKGIAEFTLKHGESKTATGLPAGIRYTVEEKDNAGYTVTKSGDIGTIEENAIAVAAFNNHKSSTAPGGGNNGGSHSGNHSGSSSGSGKPSEKLNATPQTGDNANLTFWIAVLGVSLAGVAAILIFLKKQRKKSDDKK